MSAFSSPEPGAQSPKPIILLVRPQLAENIGAVARAMANFGLSELRLVAPRDGWPNARAWEVSSGADTILDTAKVYDTTAAALADIHIAYATTARARDIKKRVVTVEEMVGEIKSMIGLSDNQMIVSSTKIALLFGPERTGLENEDIALVDTFVSIPTAPEHPSLNLAQSVVVVGYEWWKWSSRAKPRDLKDPSTRLRLAQDDKTATKQEWTGLFDQLDAYLEEIGYYRVAHKKTVMWQNMRSMLLRGDWSSQEIRTFRGMLRILYEGRKTGIKSRKNAD